MRVLIVKMSSMGDIIHTLPAVTDAVSAIPGIQFDWVVEEALAEIPMWHTQVNRVIPIALRRWRKQPWQALRSGQIKQFYRQLRLQHYDYVLDAQGSIKSAVVTRLSRGDRLGMDKNSTRELFANLAYQRTFSIPRQQHAIFRLRQLFAKALGYVLPEGLPHYAIHKAYFSLPTIGLPKNYFVFVPNTSWPEKCWSTAAWSLLLEKAAERRIAVFIPWGNENERKRALRISKANRSAEVLPYLNLNGIAAILSCAKAVVSVDTGLSHLAAALGTPSIVLYGPTHPGWIGTIGLSQIHIQAVAKTGEKRNDLSTISVETVWEVLKQWLPI